MLKSIRRGLPPFALALLVAGSVCAQAPAPAAGTPATGTAAPAPFEPRSGQAGKDVVWVPTPQALVDRMLDMAAVTPQDVLYDLGSGDGRTVITAAKRGIRARGLEYNPDMVALSERAAKAEGVSDRATFERADIFQSDFSKATVVTLFLLPNLNIRLRPILLDMPAGTRVVSNTFDMGEWNADETATVTDGCTSYCRAYKWIVPAKVGGTWKLGEGELKLTQTFQMLSGTLDIGGKSEPISEARMNGSAITFTAGGRRYSGNVAGNQITGAAEGGPAWTATRTGA